MIVVVVLFEKIARVEEFGEDLKTNRIERARSGVDASKASERPVVAVAEPIDLLKTRFFSLFLRERFSFLLLVLFFVVVVELVLSELVVIVVKAVVVKTVVVKTVVVKAVARALVRICFVELVIELVLGGDRPGADATQGANGENEENAGKLAHAEAGAK
ncbi:MAG: hypothetical protein AAGF12_19215 [Myxococcota bacterium]